MHDSFSGQVAVEELQQTMRVNLEGPFNCCQLATYDIAVNAIAPAVAQTPILGQTTQAHIDYMISKIPRGHMVDVKEIANLVAFAASKECSFTTGFVFDTSGGRATY